VRSTSAAGALLVCVGFVFLLVAFNGAPRNNAYLALGVVFVALGAARLRRARRSHPGDHTRS
jgi:hypothetical protein